MHLNNGNNQTHGINIKTGTLYQHTRLEIRPYNFGFYGVENPMRNNQNMYQPNPNERRFNNPYGYEPRDELVNPLRRPNNGPKVRLQ